MIMLFEEFVLNKVLRSLRDRRREKDDQLQKYREQGKDEKAAVVQAEIKLIQDEIDVAKSKDKVMKRKERLED
jgi:hypothetical protein